MNAWVFNRSLIRKVLFVLLLFGLLAVVVLAGEERVKSIIPRAALSPDFRPQFIRNLGGRKPGALTDPTNVTYDPATRQIYVADTGNTRVSVFDAGGKYLFSFGRRGTMIGQFTYPYGLLVTRLGRIWVSDPANRTISEYSPEGKFLRQVFYGSDGSRPGMLALGRGRVYVADLSRKQILVLNEDGRRIQSSFTRGVKLGHPQGLAVDKQDRLWVADERFGQLRLFNPDGTKAATVSLSTRREANLVRGLAIDPTGRIWLSLPVTGQVSAYDREGHYLFTLGDQNTFFFPMGITVTDRVDVLIAERGKNRVQVWGY